MVLKDRVAVVTGSGQGMGKAIAIALAQAGAKVVVNNRSPESKGGTAEETARIIKEAGGEAISYLWQCGADGCLREAHQSGD